MPNFFFTFSWVHFWSIEGGYFLQNANNLNFKLFFGCIHDPQSKYSAFILEEFWIMSHFECRLSRRFWRSKKVVQVVQIGGRGGEVIWTKSKRTATFFRETIPNKERWCLILNLVEPGERCVERAEVRSACRSVRNPGWHLEITSEVSVFCSKFWNSWVGWVYLMIHTFPRFNSWHWIC